MASGTETDRRRVNLLRITMDLVALAAIAGGADAVAMAKAARAADWRALGWKAEKLVLHAAQNPKVAADASALAATQQAATRLQNIAANEPDPDGDSEEAVAATMCAALADAGATADGLFPAPLPTVASPEKDTTTNTGNPTMWTRGLTVRPAEVIDRFAATSANIHDQNEDEDADGDDGDAEKEDADAKGENAKQAQKKRRTLPVELELMMPSLAGQSMPVVRTAEAKEIKALTKKQVTKAQREFPLVKGLPAPPKAPAPLLQLLRNGG